MMTEKDYELLARNTEWVSKLIKRDVERLSKIHKVRCWNGLADIANALISKLQWLKLDRLFPSLTNIEFYS